MIKRTIGKTGIEASIIGLGGEHLDNKPQKIADEVIGAAIDNGINIIDIFMPGKQVRTNIGKALENRRDKMIIQGAICSVDLNEQYDISRNLDVCKRYFEELLICLKTDYIDLGMLFYLDNNEAIDALYENGIIDYANELKKNGTIRAIGASTHNPDMGRRLVEEGVVEMLMFSINPAFDMMPDNRNDVFKMVEGIGSPDSISKIDPKRAELYRLCESKSVGITVMKSLGAGKLLSADHSPFSKAMTPAQCIHYALTRPAVSSVLVGCSSRYEIEEAVKYLDMSDAERDYSQAISTFKDGSKGGFKGSCVYCNHCLPCPSNINIASVNKYLDIALLDEKHIPQEVIEQYGQLDACASDCIECGNCEERCPFSVEVIANMRKASSILG